MTSMIWVNSSFDRFSVFPNWDWGFAICDSTTIPVIWSTNPSPQTPSTMMNTISMIDHETSVDRLDGLRRSRLIEPKSSQRHMANPTSNETMR